MGNRFRQRQLHAILRLNVLSSLPMSDEKIISGFGERLALENEVRALADASNVFELERRATESGAAGRQSARTPSSAISIRTTPRCGAVLV